MSILLAFLFVVEGCSTLGQGLSQSSVRVMPLSGVTGDLISGRTLQFGPYRVKSLKHKELTSRKIAIGQVQLHKSRHQYSFQIETKKHLLWKGSCTIQTHQMASKGTIAEELEANVNLFCEIQGSKKGQSWQMVFFGRSDEETMRGYIWKRELRYEISSTYLLSEELKVIEREGSYYFLGNQKVLGAMDIKKNAAFRIQKNLEAELSSAFASASTALLLFQDFYPNIKK